MNIKAVVGIFGLIIFYQIVKDLLLYFYNVIFGKTRDLTKIYGRNTYAVITGGSEGIGLGLAKALASKGFNLFLISRNIEKLTIAQKEILEKNPNCKIILRAFDFNNFHLKNVQSLSQAFKFDFGTIDVSMLINNVGTANAKKFSECTEEDLLKLVKINCLTQTLLTNFFAQIFRKRKWKSVILSVSSIAAIAPLANMSMYGASKLFNLHFSESIGNFDHQIDYYSFLPGLVATQLTRYNKSFFSCSIDESGDYAVRHIGSYRYKFSGFWKHEFVALLMHLMPVWLFSRLMRPKRKE